MDVGESLAISHEDHFKNFGRARFLWKMGAHFQESGRPQMILEIHILEIGPISIP